MQLFELSFSSEELRRLEKYVEFADRLFEVWQRFPQTGMNLKFEEEKAIRVQTSVPDEIYIDALVLRLRPFLHQREPYHYNKIHSVLWQFEADTFREQAKRYHRAFNHPDFGVNICVNGFDLTSIEGLDTWLYGDKYHFHDDKAARLERWTEAMGSDMIRVFFLQLLEVRINAILWLAQVSRVLLHGFDESEER